MRTEQCSLRERSFNIGVIHTATQTHAERPLCATVVLSLNRTQLTRKERT